MPGWHVEGPVREPDESAAEYGRDVLPLLASLRLAAGTAASARDLAPLLLQLSDMSRFIAQACGRLAETALSDNDARQRELRDGIAGQLEAMSKRLGDLASEVSSDGEAEV